MDAGETGKPFTIQLRSAKVQCVIQTAKINGSFFYFVLKTSRFYQIAAICYSLFHLLTSFNFQLSTFNFKWHQSKGRLMGAIGRGL